MPVASVKKTRLLSRFIVTGSFTQCLVTAAEMGRCRQELYPHWRPWVTCHFAKSFNAPRSFGGRRGYRYVEWWRHFRSRSRL